jgi:hypothetical protein
MHRVEENLTSHLILEDIKQKRDSPVIMVGYSSGGLEIKELYCHAQVKLHRNRDRFQKVKVEKFIGNISEICHYATKYHGNKLLDKLANQRNSPVQIFQFK